MKFLSEKKCMYFLFFETLLAVLISFFVTIFTYGGDNNILQKNFFYQIVSFSITLFIYLNITKINRELKIASFLIISKAFIDIIINVIIPLSTPIIIFKFFLGDVLEFISLSLNIPFSFYFYNGCALLVSQKTKNILLIDKWKGLVTPSIIIDLLGCILHIIKLYGNSLTYPQIPEITLALLFGLAAFAIYLEILRAIYLFKTAKAL